MATMRKSTKRAAIAFAAVAIIAIAIVAPLWKPLLIEWHLRGLRECDEVLRQHLEAAPGDSGVPIEKLGLTAKDRFYATAQLDRPSQFFVMTHRFLGFPGKGYFATDTGSRKNYHRSALEQLGEAAPIERGTIPDP